MPNEGLDKTEPLRLMSRHVGGQGTQLDFHRRIGVQRLVVVTYACRGVFDAALCRQLSDGAIAHWFVHDESLLLVGTR